MRRAFASAICVGLALAAASGAKERADYKVVGYYVSWAAYARGYTPRSIDTTRFTHLIYAFASIRDGALALGDGAADPGNLAELQGLRRKVGQLRILVAVGGWEGSAEFSDLSASDPARQRFVSSVVAFLRNFGLDGIDIDWEYPVAGGKGGNVHRTADRENFTHLLQALRSALDAAGREDSHYYSLTIAAGASADALTHLDVTSIARLVDWIGLMSYDFSGAWSKTSGHNAPLAADPDDPAPGSTVNSVSAAVARYLAAGVPRSKLLLGLPLYGRTWKGCDHRRDGEYQMCDGPAQGTWEEGVLDYRDIAKNYVTNPRFQKNWNQVAMVPFLFDESSGQFVSYDDARSIGHKLRLIKANELAGAMLWEISADREGTLLDVVTGELRTP
jgi:chitinase